MLGANPVFSRLVAAATLVWSDAQALLGAQDSKSRALKKKLSIALSVTGGLLALFVVWALLFGPLSSKGLPSWARSHVPNDTQAVLYVNLDKYRTTDLPQELDQLIPSSRQNTFVRFDEVREVFVALRERANTIAVFRTDADLPVADLLVSTVRRNSQPDSYKGFDYARVPATDECLAKTGDRTYCGTETELDMEETLKRLSLADFDELDQGLERAVATVAGSDYYVAGRIEDLREPMRTAADALDTSSRDADKSPWGFVPSPNAGTDSTSPARRTATAQSHVKVAAGRMLKAFARGDWFAASVTLDDSACFFGRVVFSDPKDAEDLTKAAGAFREVIVENMDDLARVDDAPGDSRRHLGKYFGEVLDATQISRRGGEVRLDIRVKMTAIVEMLKGMSGKAAR